VVGDVVVEQREIELHVQRFLVELTRQVHASLGRIDVGVEVQHEVVGDDRVARCKERHEPIDEVPFGGRQLAIEVSRCS